MNGGDEFLLIISLIGAAIGYGSGFNEEETWRMSTQRAALGAGVGAIIALILLVIAISNGYKP